MPEYSGAGHRTGGNEPIDPGKINALYGEWVNAAKGNFDKQHRSTGGQASFAGVLFQRQNRRPGTPDEVEKVRKRLSNWTNPKRKDAPGDLTDALISLVERYAPQAPARYAELGLAFERVADLMNENNGRAQREGGAKGEATRRAAGEIGRAIRLEHAVVDPVARCEDLLAAGLAEWGDQSSWVTSGEVPPYVRRQVDELLWKRLDEATGVQRPDQDPPQRSGPRGPVLLVGDPKTGKTRTLLHVLARHNATQGLGYWRVRARTDAVKQAIITLSENRATQQSGSTEAAEPRDVDKHNRIVVIFDDLHHHLRLGLVSDADLDRLISLGAVVVGTMQASTLDTMRRMVRKGPDEEDAESLFGITSARLLHQLEAGAIVVPAELTTEELIGFDRTEVIDLFVRLHELGYPNPVRLPEILAAVDYLEAHAGEGRGRPAHLAILSAALHATVIHPAGATFGELSVLHRWAYEQVERIRPWSSKVFEEAFDWATTTVGGPGSSHALLIPSPDRSGAYRLLDAMVPRIADQASDIDLLGDLWPHRNELAPASAFYAGNHAHFVLRDLAAARDWWVLAATGEYPSAMYNLGVLAHRADDLEKARAWWEQAAASGHGAALFNLGVLALAAKDLVKAGERWEQAVQHGDVAAMYNLGDLADKRGDTQVAIDWWQRAAAAGDTRAMTALGVAAQSAGHHDQALDWWQRAAAAGDTDAMTNLGMYSEDSAGARFWFLRAARYGNAEAMFALGMLAHQEGDRDEARYWWTQAAAEGHPRAMAALAALDDD